MLKFISFGSGSSGNCYYFYNESDSLMIDAGVGIRTLKRSFFNYGLSMANIKNILVTHDHSDHIKSVGAISHQYNIDVYATPQVHFGITRNYCVKVNVPPEHQKNVENGNTYAVGNFQVTPFHVPHDSQDCVGYRIVYGDRVVVIATDVGHITDELRDMVRQADYLILEANHDEDMLRHGPYAQHLKERILGNRGHLSNVSCAQVLQECASERLKHVWLCHLSEENNHPELVKKTMERILGEHNILIGRNFELDVLKRKTPTGIFMLE